jgi:hypothetical protein
MRAGIEIEVGSFHSGREVEWERHEIGGKLGKRQDVYIKCCVTDSAGSGGLRHDAVPCRSEYG